MLVLLSDNDHNMIEPEIYVGLASAIEGSDEQGNPVVKDTTRLEILKTGSWDTVKGKFELTASDLREFADNFHKNVRPHSSTAGLPIDTEHKKKEAYGWLHAPQVEANSAGGHSLFMEAKWTKPGREKVADGTFKFFSPEVHFKHIDPEGKLPVLRNVLMGGGLTNRPLFKGLDAIPALTASDGTADPDNKIYLSKESNMTLAEILKKKNSELDASERQVLDAAKDQLTSAQLKEFYPAEVEASEREAAEKKAADEKAAADKAAADKKKADELAASEGNVTQIDASELATLQANAAKGLEASEKLRRNEAEQEVTEMCFSESAGFKLPTDMKKDVTDLWLDASEEQKKTLKTVFEKAAPLNAGDFSERGTDQTGGDGSAQDLLEDKVSEIQASEAGKDMDYTAALKEARRKNPEIAKQVDHEIGIATPQLVGR
jgi:hypothetical protein